jgi:magnesium transporter
MDSKHLSKPVRNLMQPAPLVLREGMTVAEALDEIRAKVASDIISYFYVESHDGRLTGVIPVRSLLTAPLDAPLLLHMIRELRTLRESDSVLDACEAFAMHKLLAFPVVDADLRLVGVVDIKVFTDEIFEVTEHERMEELFEAIGFRISQVQGAGALTAWRFRFPWLLATIASGLACAFLAGAFQHTLASSLTLAFFMTLVLGLGESLSIQTMTMTVQELRMRKPTWRWFVVALRREATAAALLGASSGALASALAWLWLGETTTTVVLGVGILLAMIMATAIGLGIPTLLHAFRLDPKIAAGPVTLALTDLSTLLIYFSLAGMAS